MSVDLSDITALKKRLSKDSANLLLILRSKYQFSTIEGADDIGAALATIGVSTTSVEAIQFIERPADLIALEMVCLYVVAAVVNKVMHRAVRCLWLLRIIYYCSLPDGLTTPAPPQEN